MDFNSIAEINKFKNIIARTKEFEQCMRSKSLLNTEGEKSNKTRKMYFFLIFPFKFYLLSLKMHLILARIQVNVFCTFLFLRIHKTICTIASQLSTLFDPFYKSYIMFVSIHFPLYVLDLFHILSIIAISISCFFFFFPS